MSVDWQDGRITPLSTQIRSLLTLAFLTMLTLCFYLLLLGLAVFTLYFLIGIIQGLVNSDQPGLSLSLLIGAGYFCWGILTVLLARIPAPEGIIQQHSDLPAIFSLMERVCARVDAPCAKLVRFVPGTTIAVTEEGTMLLLPFASQRVLNIGVAILQSLAVDDFKAILAHEFAHFSRRDPFTYRLVNRVIRSFNQYTGYAHKLSGWRQIVPGAGCGDILLHPSTLLIGQFARFFLFAARRFAREGELAADRTAALAYGPETLAIALKKYLVESCLFEGNLSRMMTLLITADMEPENLYRRYRRFRDHISDNKLQQTWTRLRQVQGTRSGMYPSISERLEHIHSMRLVSSVEEDSEEIRRLDGLGVSTADGDQEAVREMIEDIEDIERRLSRTLLDLARHLEAQMQPKLRRTHSPLVRTLTTGPIRWVVAFAVLIVPNCLAFWLIPLEASISADGSITFPNDPLRHFVASATALLFLLFLTMTHKRR